MIDWATALGFVANLLILWILVKHWQAFQKTTGLATLERIIAEYGNEESRKDRRLLYAAFLNMRPSLFPDSSYLDPLRDQESKPVPEWLESKRDELFQASERVRNSLDRIGFLVESGYLPFDNRLVEFIGKSARDMWEILEPLLRERRTIRKDPTTGRQFQRFVKRIEKLWPEVLQSLEEQ